MNEEKYVAKLPQSLALEDRSRLSITGVEDVDSFDECTVCLKTRLGRLTVYGSSMKIGKFNVDTGELSLEGDIAAMCYAEQDAKRGRKSRVWR